MGMESLLGGDVGLPLVDGKASSVPVTALIVLISEVSQPSRVCNLLETMSLILKISPFCSLNSFVMGLKPLPLEHTLYIRHKTEAIIGHKISPPTTKRMKEMFE